MANVSQSLVEEFFKTLGTAAQEVVNASPSDLTIDAEIVSIVNIDGGEYKVNYQGNIFSAYSEPPTTTYKMGERVYILVPQGDMSRKKLIYGRSSYRNDASAQALNAMKNFYVDQGPNWADLYKSSKDLSICACPAAEEDTLVEPARYYHFGFIREILDEERASHPHRVYEGTAVHTGGELETLDDQFNTWGKSNEYLKIQATFQTKFTGIHNTGKYSLQVNCLQVNPKYVADPEAPDYVEGEEQYKIIAYELGFTNFDGVTPYSIVEPSVQKGYFQVPKGGIVGIHSIGLIQDGEMQFEIPLSFDVDGMPTYKSADAQRNVNNILVSNIQVCFAKQVSLTDTMYYPYIETPVGASLYGPNGTDRGRASVDLIAHLQYGDTDLTEQENCRVHWFRRKADVTESSAAGAPKDEFSKTYFDYGGPGWYPCERIDEEQQPFEVEDKRFYRVNGNKLTVYIDAVPWKWDYKAVITYGTTEIDSNGKEYFKEINQTYAIQTVVREDSKYDLELRAVAGELPGVYEVVNHNDTAEGRDMVGTWYEKALDDSYNRISDPFWVGPLNVLANPFSSWSVLSVQCYDPYLYAPSGAGTATMSDANEIGVLEMQLGSNTEAPFVVDWEGDDFFKYDAQGQWKGEKDHKEYVITPVVRFAEGCACSYSIKVAAPDGEILGNYEYYKQKSDGSAFKCWNNDKQFLVTQAYVDRYFGIHFHVCDTYDKKKAENNIFTITIFTDDQRQFTFTKQIAFTKDGDLGTNGTEWNVRLRPCKWKASSKEGLFVNPYTDDHPYPLVVDLDPAGPDDGVKHYKQNEDFRLFLRPFVSRGGTPLEELDKEQAYFYRCSWDVRSPGADSLEKSGRLSSFLRLFHTTRATAAAGETYVASRGKPFDVATGGAFETGSEELRAGDGMEDIRVNELMKTPAGAWKTYEGSTVGTPAINGLVAHTIYPLNPEKKLLNPEDPKNPFVQPDNECYGAVEVCYFDNSNISKGTGATLEQCHYRFVVKCTVEVLQGSYDYAHKVIETSVYSRVVTSLVCYYPVDVFFNEDGLTLNMEDFREALTTNWPTTVKYDAIGYSPEHADEIMDFHYNKSENLFPFNLTPDTINLAKFNVEYDKEGQITSYDLKLRPVSHLSKQEGYHGAIRTEFGDWPEAANSWYLRNIVMYYNRFGNADINGWDGQGLDTNEEEGTVFGVTFGAGWKGQFSNAFTGVLMGVDKNVKRSDYREYMSELDYPDEAEESHPYLTGLFGYQEGVQSFGLLENGTAFFGRADRGGRIIIDGSNATIYGGANGLFGAPSIGDPMWNTLRINLVDLNHQKDGQLWTLEPDSFDSGDPQTPGDMTPTGYKTRNENGEPVIVNFDGQSYGYKKDKDEGQNWTVPHWYANMWRNSYIQPWGAKPYWLLGYDDAESGSKVTYEVEDLQWWLGDEINVEDENDVNNNRRINYFDSSWIELNTKDIKDNYVDTGLIPPLSAELDKYDKFPYSMPVGEDGSTIPAELTDYPYIKDQPELQQRLKLLRELGVKLSLSSYGAQRASTTPAIEVGQHIPGLRPGLIAWRDYESLYQNQRIPGDRNFLVTYDGTLWAMNGIFMGNVIGANIVGGRMQASQIGVGPPTDQTTSEEEEDAIYTFFGEFARYHCQWYELIPPEDDVTDLDIYPSKKTGYSMTIDENGITMFGGEVIGGSMDIGHFHVLGYKTLDRLKNLGHDELEDSELYHEELGHLIQTGKSDFIGITHFYGNVGIAPTTIGTWNDRSNSGSLVQVSGFTALGVLLPSIDDLKSHQYIDNFIRNEASDYYSADGVTYDEIGEGGSVEQSSVFAIESRGSNEVETDFDGGGIKAHFWPLHYFSKRRVDEEGNTFVDSYVTMMNQFKSKAKNAGSETGYATKYEGSNYFRVSPWGLEGQEFFVRNLFQPEKNSVEPKPDEMSKEDSSQHTYRGYIGAVSRAGYGEPLPFADDIGALGITTWNNNAIILHSDDNFALRNRRTAFFYANMQSINKVNKETWTEAEGDLDLEANLAIQMKCAADPKDGDRKVDGYGMIDIKTVASPVGMCVYKPGSGRGAGEGEKFPSSDKCLGTVTYHHSAVRGAAADSPSAYVGALLSLNPYCGAVVESGASFGGSVDQGKPAVILACTSDGKSDALQGGGVHIFCVPSDKGLNNTDCRTNPYAETFWSENEIRSWAKTKVGIFSQTEVVMEIGGSGVHSTPKAFTKGLSFTASKAEIKGYSADQQFGIYARFA